MRISVTAQTVLLQQRREEREYRRKEEQERIQREIAAMPREELEQWQDEIIARIEAVFRARIITKYERQSPEERELTANRDARILQSPRPRMSARESETILARMEAERRPQVLAEYLALPLRERRAEAKKAAVDYERHEAERQARIVGPALG